MSITSAIVLYAVLWFVTFLTVIPFRLKTQGDVGIVTPGTQAGAPHEHNLKKKAWITSALAAVFWLIIVVIIQTETVTVRDLDWFNRMDDASSPYRDTNG